MIFVVGGGGGLSSKNAVLVVTIPAGSTVTATKGTASLKPTLWTKGADSTLECAIFSIPASKFDSTTPWTITATDGTNTASTTVLITTNKEYEVTLPFNFYIVSLDGVMLDSSEYTKSASYAPTISQYTGYVRVASATGNSEMGLVYTTERIDISNLNYLYVDYLGAAQNYQGAAWWLGLINDPSAVSSVSTTGFVAKVQMPVKSTRGVVYLDISNCQGEYYLGFTACGYGGGAATTANIYTMAAVAVLPD